MGDIKSGYYAYWIGNNTYSDAFVNNILKPEWKLYLLHSTNNYAYFRLFKIKYNLITGDTSNAIYTEIKELKNNNKKKLKYSLRKDKTNWLGEIPCFKTSCVKEYKDDGNYKITLPFNLENEKGSFNVVIDDDNDKIFSLGGVKFDTLEKQILEQQQKLEPPKPSNKVANGSDAPLEEPKEETKEEPKQDTVVSEISKIHEEEMNIFLQQLQFVSDNFTGGEKDSLIIGLCNLQVEKNMLKLKGLLLDKLKEEIKEKMGDSEFFV